MPAKAATPPTFSGPELAKLLALIKGADSVELKLTIPEQHQRSAVAALAPSSGRSTATPCVP